MRYTYDPATLVMPAMEWEEYFEYDPSSPTFLTNRTTRSPKALEGAPAGCVGKKEIKVRFNGKFFRSARIIWEMFYGPIPDNHLIRFKDGNSFNLLIENLELQTFREKGLRKKQTVGSSGEKGISIRNGRFAVQVKYKGKSVYLGTYASMEEALTARDRALKLTM